MTGNTISENEIYEMRCEFPGIGFKDPSSSFLLFFISVDTDPTKQNYLEMSPVECYYEYFTSEM